MEQAFISGAAVTRGAPGELDSAVRRSKSITRLAFWLCLFIPIARPVHVLISHFTLGTWSWPVAFLYPETIGVILLAALCLPRRESIETLRRRLASNAQLRVIFGAAAGFVAWTAVSSLAQSAFSGYWIRSLLMGWILPMLLALSLLSVPNDEGLRAAWRGLVIGSGLLLAAALVLYFVSFGFPTSFEELMFTNRLMKMSGRLREGIYFGGLTLGNCNDIALFFGAFVSGLWGWYADPLRRKSGWTGTAAAALAGALVLEYLCYSRGVLLTLFGVFLLGAVVARVWPDPRRKLRLAGILGTLFFASLFAGKGSLEYWVGQFQFSEGRGSTSAFRAGLWERALSDPRRAFFYYQGPKGAGGPLDLATRAERDRLAPRVVPLKRRLIFGYGLGSYGVFQGMTYEAGTHHAFLDALVNAGIPGFLLFSAFWFSMLQGILRRARSHLRSPANGSSAISPLSAAAIALTLTSGAVLVNFRVETLGIILNGVVLWLLILGSGVWSRPAESGPR